MQNNYIVPILCIITLILFHDRIFTNKSILKHIKFSYECFDRFITNCICKQLQYEKGLCYYLFEKYGAISSEVLKVRTSKIHEHIEEIAKENKIEIKKIKIGNNLLEPSKKELKKLQPLPSEEDRIIAIFKQLDYSNSWNFKSPEKKLKRKTRRVYHYTIYHWDKNFGLGSHTINTYLPNNIRGYFNQHNWISQQLKHQGLFNDDIKMYYNSFQHIGTIDPVKFQELCDSITFHDIIKYDRKWIRNLFPELNGLWYNSYINEAEFSSNIVFKQKAFLNSFYINRCISGYELGLPENLSFIFKRRIDRRYKDPFNTKLKIVETKPSLKIKYKSQQYKEYIKWLLSRSECTTNNTRDLDLKKQDFEGVRKASRGINERAMSIKEPVNPDWLYQHFENDPFERTIVGKKWIPGLKINDENIRSVLKGFSKQNVIGFSMRDLTDFVNNDLGKSFTMSQIRYIVRKLRAHGIVEKLDRKNLYRLTALGRCFARMFLLIIEKVILPFVHNADKLSRNQDNLNNNQKDTDIKSNFFVKLNNIYSSIEKDIHRLIQHLDINISFSPSSIT